ncbi:thiol-disulfide oxidoreductase DCC family protein [Zavarzinia sp. CC-PAN008]|uniref:thiol-disulfide oxidoreductase DCC family protein n=1 Tax=Zavarzinia sp. CC-PAN008 TaxID=3243332 RepID=UPI003F74824C
MGDRHERARGGDWRPRAANAALEGIILFDGVCVFCSRWVRFVAERDRAERFRFLPIQSAAGRTLARRLGIDADAPQTNAVVLDGRALFKSDAALAVLGHLPRWSWLRGLRLVPRPLRDAVYDVVARNRYRVFGRTESCWLPPPDLARRLADGGTVDGGNAAA